MLVQPYGVNADFGLNRMALNSMVVDVHTQMLGVAGMFFAGECQFFDPPFTFFVAYTINYICATAPSLTPSPLWKPFSILSNTCAADFPNLR